MDHLSLFLIQLIKAFTRLTLTPSGNDEWAAGEAEFGTLRNVSVAVDGGGRWSRRQEGCGVVMGVLTTRDNLLVLHLCTKESCSMTKGIKQSININMKSHIRFDKTR